jgi:hypothetical protein
MEEQLNRHFKAIGIERLIERASVEKDSWQAILRRHGDDGRYIPAPSGC